MTLNLSSFNPSAAKVRKKQLACFKLKGQYQGGNILHTIQTCCLDAIFPMCTTWIFLESCHWHVRVVSPEAEGPRIWGLAACLHIQIERSGWSDLLFLGKFPWQVTSNNNACTYGVSRFSLDQSDNNPLQTYGILYTPCTVWRTSHYCILIMMMYRERTRCLSFCMSCVILWLEFGPVERVVRFASQVPECR